MRWKKSLITFLGSVYYTLILTRETSYKLIHTVLYSGPTVHKRFFRTVCC